MHTKQYYSIEPALFKLDGGAMFGIIPKPLWNKVHPSDEQNRIDLALRLVLIIDGNRKILIDTGIGDYHGEKFDQRFGITDSNSPLEYALKEININPEDITDLIISHLHFDHVGGIVKKVNDSFNVVFPNATLHLHKKHFEYSKNPTQRDTGSFEVEFFMPAIEYYKSKNKIEFYNEDEGSLSCGLKYKTSNGHTPYLMHAYDEKFIYMADLVPTSNHVHIPWVMGYDINPGITTEDKASFYDFIYDNSLTMIYEHDPKFAGSKLIKNDKGQYNVSGLISLENKKAYQILKDL